LSETRKAEHANCVVCSSTNSRGLQLEFAVGEDGAVSAHFACSRAFQGYGGFLHGGVISALLDGAMTNCLFADGHAAFTAELNVRFLHPVVIGEAVTVRAWIDRSHSILKVLKGEVVQGNQVMATASGKFLERHRHDCEPNPNALPRT
jgi:uncharacterized protein (TIGR00369 family)